MWIAGGHSSAASDRLASRAASTAAGAESNTDMVESPPPVDLIRLPPRASTASAISSSWRTSASAIASGSDSHNAVEPLISEQQNVTTPVGSAVDQPARRRSTSSPGVCGRRAGSVAIPSRIAASSCSACAGSKPAHAGSTPAGAEPVSSANAVAASAYTSLARDGMPPAASSGAR
jgi:hypothetical protein